MSLLALFDPVVALLHSAVVAVSGLVSPWSGAQSTAVALILVTLAIRACLVPFAVRVTRAERVRTALAPELAALRRRYGADRQQLAREVQKFYRRAGVGPFSGLGSGLAQAPVLFAVYRLCLLPVVAGAPNAVLMGQFWGLSLATHLPFLVGAGAGPAAVLGGLLLLGALVAVAAVSSVQATHRAKAAGIEGPMLLPAQVLPFGIVLTAAFVPVAVCLYLLTSTTWSVLERVVLARTL